MEAFKLKQSKHLRIQVAGAAQQSAKRMPFVALYNAVTGVYELVLTRQRGRGWASFR